MAPVEIKAADDPVELAARIGRQPRLFDEGVLIAIGVEPEGDGAAGERSSQVDAEFLIEGRIGRGAGETRAVELIVDGGVEVRELADKQVRTIRVALVACRALD